MNEFIADDLLPKKGLRRTVKVSGMMVQVNLLTDDPDLKAALIALGWTPPETMKAYDEARIQDIHGLQDLRDAVACLGGLSALAKVNHMLAMKLGWHSDPFKRSVPDLPKPQQDQAKHKPNENGWSLCASCGKPMDPTHCAQHHWDGPVFLSWHPTCLSPLADPYKRHQQDRQNPPGASISPLVTSEPPNPHLSPSLESERLHGPSSTSLQPDTSYPTETLPADWRELLGKAIE